MIVIKGICYSISIKTGDVYNDTGGASFNPGTKRKLFGRGIEVEIDYL